MGGEFECTPVFGQSTNGDDGEWELGRNGWSLRAMGPAFGQSTNDDDDDDQHL